MVVDVPDCGFETNPNALKFLIESVISTIDGYICVPLYKEYFPRDRSKDQQQAKPINPATPSSPAWLRDFLFAHPVALPTASIDAAYVDPLTVCRELRTPAGRIDCDVLGPRRQRRILSSNGAAKSRAPAAAVAAPITSNLFIDRPAIASLGLSSEKHGGGAPAPIRVSALWDRHRGQRRDPQISVAQGN
jgi:hypothetical protein